MHTTEAESEKLINSAKIRFGLLLDFCRPVDRNQLMAYLSMAAAHNGQQIHPVFRDCMLRRGENVDATPLAGRAMTWSNTRDLDNWAMGKIKHV